MSSRQERLAAQAAAELARRRAALMALRPVVMPPAEVAAWSELVERLVDDPPAWSPSPRYVALMREYCAEAVRIDGYNAELASVRHEVYRETGGSGEARVKVNPFVALRAQALKRQRELMDMLELSPRGARRAQRSQFDAA